MKHGLSASVMAGLGPSLSVSGCSRGAGKKPSIILIIVDTLRPDHLNCYGYFRDTSPNINDFARNSLQFEHCYSHAPATSGSCASILSGFLQHETKLLFNGYPLIREVETLPEILQRHGYTTAAVVGNYILRRRMGWSQGFSIYDDTMDDKELVRRVPEKTAENMTDRAIELLQQFQHDPLFMWIHYQDPHGPYTPPSHLANLFWNPDEQTPRELKINGNESGIGGIPNYQKLQNSSDFHYYVSQYDSEIRHLDEQFKRLVETLKQTGLYDNALIMFTSDHGEGMGERNYYFAHGENLYNCLLHVPLVIRHGREFDGKRTDYVQHLDIVPTVLEFAGIKSDKRFRGRDLRTEPVGKREILSASENLVSLTYDGFKLIRDNDGDQNQLFDLTADPEERHDLANHPDYSEKVKELMLKTNGVLADDRLNLNVVVRPPKLVEEEMRKLKSLGYTQ